MGVCTDLMIPSNTLGIGDSLRDILVIFYFSTIFAEAQKGFRLQAGGDFNPENKKCALQNATKISL
ncbi:hypothetical protein NIES4071_06510 [Calothrix sp. NIES-4071]|nr:hypothetical protein NIES4071_06510 [Calothrix sp. NIES-4071]BAZ54993.1 hypothetical protein NIES4105_06470 [Calothrix sp. NIES-4105]